MNRVLKAFAIAFAVVVALVSCKKEDQAKEVALTGIELNATTQALQVGQDFQLKVTYKPENATNKPEVTWASDAPAVATVDAGKVVAVAAGTAKITAKAGAFSATCTVTVTSAEEEIVPVEGNSAWSVIGAFLDSDWKKDYVCAEKDGAFVLKNVKLAKDNKVKFRKDKDWAVNRGINKENEAAELAADTPTKAIQGGGDIIIPSDGIYDLYYFAEKEAIVYVAKDAALPEIPDFTEETPEGLVMDGDASDWAALNPANVVNIELPADAELNWIKNAKVYYDDKLYVLLELSDEAIAYSKTRFYLFFDTAELGNLTQHWAKSTIDYMTEGKIIVSGAPVAYSASLYAHNAELGGWKWTETGVAPTFDCKGAGNLYEFSMAYDNFPGTLPEAFNIGFQVADSDYATTGFLPQAEKMARIVKVGATDPGEGGEEDTWDYTPSAEYLAEDNLWKAVDAKHTIESFYNPNWTGEKTAPELAFKESTYKVTLPDACPVDWNAQYWIRPTEQLVLDPAKKYSLKFTVNASTDGQFYVKLYQKGVDGAWSTETNPRVELTANESYEIKLDDFSPITTPQDLLIDFSHHEANTTFYIKDIILKVTGEVPQPVEWDYAPSEEYLASSNLWKAKAAGHEMYYYYNASGADWNGSDIVDSTVPFLTINQSTYELNYAAATNELWQKQFFVFPAEGNEIPFEADKTYKLKVTLGTDAVKTPGFFKLAKYNDSNVKKEGEAIWEKGNVSLAGSEPLVIESPEITGVDCSNINLMFAFGGNSADTKVYIKDIIVEEVGGEVPPVVDAPESDVITVDILPTAYPSEETVVKNGDIEYNILLVANYGNGIQMKKQDSYISNKTAFKNIKTIKVTTATSKTLYPENLKLCAGTSENPTTEIPMKSGDSETAVWELDGEYTYFKLQNVSGYAVYLSKIEINPASDPAPTGIKIDGDFSDWAGIEALSGNRPDGSSNSRIAEWKMSSDADNIYAYFKITKSKITNSRYFYVGFDFDKNESTGSSHDGIPGLEAYAVVYPAVAASDPVAFVNGIDPQSTVYDNAGSFAEGVVTVYGVQDPASEDYVLFEMSIPRDKVGLAAGSALTVASSYNNYTTGKREVTL